MIVELIVIGILLFLVVPSAYRVGLSRSSKQIPQVPEHQHIWGPWEDITINIKDTTTGGVKYTLSGQKRYCLNCNKKEVRTNE